MMRSTPLARSSHQLSTADDEARLRAVASRPVRIQVDQAAEVNEESDPYSSAQSVFIRVLYSCDVFVCDDFVSLCLRGCDVAMCDVSVPLRLCGSTPAASVFRHKKPPPALLTGV